MRMRVLVLGKLKVSKQSLPPDAVGALNKNADYRQTIIRYDWLRSPNMTGMRIPNGLSERPVSTTLRTSLSCTLAAR